MLAASDGFQRDPGGLVGDAIDHAVMRGGVHRLVLLAGLGLAHAVSLGA
jgi:hypothetical protein